MQAVRAAKNDITIYCHRCLSGGAGSSAFALVQFNPTAVDLALAGHGQATAPKPGLDSAALHAKIERLKQIAPDPSHAMKKVEDRFTNLWFADKAKNWPLAELYWNETLSPLHWAVRIIPVRNAGREIKLEALLQAVENSPTMNMGDLSGRKLPTSSNPPIAT